jgi:O-antigen/teichoic acid export membrane protein
MTVARDTISRNAGFAFAVKMTGAAFTAVLTIFLVRYLGPARFGAFTLALSIGGLVLLPSDLGIARSTARYVAEATTDRGRIAAVLSDALRLKLLASGLVSVALAALAGPIASAYGVPEIALPLRILALSIVFESFLLLFDAVFQALGRIATYLRVILVESASEALLSIGIVLLGGGVAGAVAGRAAGYLFAAGYGLVLLVRTIRPARLTLRRRRGGHTRRIMRYGSALLVIDGAFTLFSRLDAILIGSIISVPAVGIFEAPMRLMRFIGFFGQSISSGVAPRMARVGGAEPDRKSLQRGLRIVVALQGVFLAPLVVWARPFTELVLGSGYGESAAVLRALAPYAFLVGISPMVALSVNYLGEARRRVPIAIAALLLNVVVDVALLGRIGVVAAAIGTDLAYAFYVAAHLLILRALTGLPLRPLVVGVGRSLLAAAAMAAVLLAFGTSQIALPLLVLGAVSATFAYAGALLAVGAITPTELRQGLARLRASLRSPPRPWAR